MADFIRQNSRSFVRLRSPQWERLLDVLGEAGIAFVQTGDGAIEVDNGRIEALGELAARHQLVLHELSGQQASLEEAFMQMTAGSVEYHAHGATTPGGPPAAPPDWGAGQPTPRWGATDQGKGV